MVPSTAVPRPHVDAIATGEGTTYAAGLFDTMKQGATSYPLSNIVAFDTSTGAVRGAFNASVNGQVWDLALDTATDSLYVAGDFTAVNGATRTGLVKLDSVTGAIKSFALHRGKVNDIDLVQVAGKQRLLVGGPNKLVSLDPIGGKNDGYLAVPFASPIDGAWGGVAVYQFAVDPTGTRLVATGNFQSVGGQPRTRFVMLDLGATGASVSPWYYEPFAKPCASTHARRIAYLQGVDWSPDGTAFNVAATGQITKFKDEIWRPGMTDAAASVTTVCDAVGRFSLADDTKPQWVNYTGGDSVWRVLDTGSAVYASGHFQWLDNADGFASEGHGDKVNGTPAVSRLAVGAIDPVSGRALSWAPNTLQSDPPRGTGFKQGGKSLLATSTGLWMGNDSTRFGGQPRYGLAFAPLPGV